MLYLSATEEVPAALLEDCIGKIAGGDKGALGTLYEHTKDAVYGFSLSIVQNAHEAEDVLQDTFVSIFTSAGGYQKMGKPLAWILTIARNLSLMKIRGRKKSADISQEEWSLFAADAAAVSSEDRLLLTAALKTVTPE